MRADSGKGNGRHMTFASDASTLVSGDTNSLTDIFVHDRQSGQIMHENVASSGAQANSSSEWPSISADGRYVAFQSYAGNLARGDNEGHIDVFVHDR